MIPRLPPLLLALLGGGAIYGIKYTLDKFEPKAIGPPGSSEHYEKVLKYRQNVKRLGIAAAVSGVVFAGYLVYDSSNQRKSPMTKKDQDANEFYQDQYSSREKTFALDKVELDKKQKERELKAQKQLEQEVLSMENVLNRNKRT